MELNVNWPAFDTIGDLSAFHQRLFHVKALGFKKVRLDIHLSNINTAEGTYNVSQLDAIMNELYRAGVEVVMYVVGTPVWNRPMGATDDTFPPADLTKFVTACVYLAKRYPQLKYFQVWNEWNTSGFWKPAPAMQAYADMMYALSTTFAADTVLNKVNIVLGGCAYLGQVDNTAVNAMDALNAIIPLEQVCHVVAYHPYPDPSANYTSNEAEIWRRCRARNDWIHAKNLQAWATEIGKSTFPSSYTNTFQQYLTEDEHADFTRRAVQAMIANGFDSVFLFRLDDRNPWNGSDRDAFYGLMRVDGTLKPAYNEVMNQQRLLGAVSG